LDSELSKAELDEKKAKISEAEDKLKRVELHAQGIMNSLIKKQKELDEQK